jgi:hypothetical protein
MKLIGKRLHFGLAMMLIVGCMSCTGVQERKKIGERWSVEKAQKWAAEKGWLTGANFTPSTAINQLEFWQAESFDPETIERELGWAESIGFNTVRCYLHHLAWQVDPKGFLDRVDRFLSIAANHKIEPVLVIFDDCWNPAYTAGKQPDPKPGVHNSGWIRDPGDLLFTDTTLMKVLEEYEKALLMRFTDDRRILFWDLYNEPGNSGYAMKSMPLLKNAFRWAREANPSQPVTAGLWYRNFGEMNRFQAENSDIITYHNYSDEKDHARALDSLKLYGRPLICTEYMARTNGSRFENILPLLKERGVGAINWGLVSGKTNTIYAWNTPIPDGSEPLLWFHDIFRKDGTPYDKAETDLIRQMNNRQK